MRPASKLLYMAASLKVGVGQHLQGKLGSYKVLEQLHRDVWTAIDTKHQKVIVKTAPKQRLDNESHVLECVRGHPNIRQIIDTTYDPPSLILRYLDDDLLSASHAKKLEEADVKFVAREILEALSALHKRGYVHTANPLDIKPDNILINYSGKSTRFSEVQLGDCGDAWHVKPDADLLEEGHIIGAAIFRSPEAMLNLRWGTPTDIWSFGATLISLIWGYNWHIFKPDNVAPDHEEYSLQVLVKQISIFGPVSLNFKEIADDDRLGILTAVITHINDNNLWKPFSRVEDVELSEKDRDFIGKIMKLDPRDRPTAKELLQDEWFGSA